MVDRSMASLDGKVAIVTGSGQGVGKGMALGLAAFGANIAVVDRNEETAHATARELEGMGAQAMPYVANVRDLDRVKEMVKSTVERFSRVDILINNVGGGFPSSFLDLSPNGWSTLLDVNLKTVFNCTKTVADEMIRLGNGGSIIQVTSIEAHRGAPSWSVYSACKAGLENFTRTMALELSHHKIRVNSVAPGHIVTPGVPQEGDSEQHFWEKIPLGRAGGIEDMAGPAVFLCSDMSKYITGTTVYIDGGMWAASGNWTRRADNTWSAR